MLGWISNDVNVEPRNGDESHPQSNPRRDRNALQESAESNLRRGINYMIRACRQHVSSARLVACVVLRVILLRGVMLDVQCSWDGIEVRITLCNRSKRYLLTNHRHSSLSSSRFSKLPVIAILSRAPSPIILRKCHDHTLFDMLFSSGFGLFQHLLVSRYRGNVRRIYARLMGYGVNLYQRSSS